MAGTHEVELEEDVVGRQNVFAGLGTGEGNDQLDLRLILQIFWRTVPLLSSVKRHLAAYIGSVLFLFLPLVPLILIAMDSLWNGIFAGNAISPSTAAFLFMDASQAVDVESLSVATRTELRDHVVIGGVLACLLGFPIGAGLFLYQVWILQRINQVLRIRLFERFQALSLRFHADSRVGDSIYRLYQDSAMVTNVIESLFLQPLMFAVRFALGTFVVFLFDPLLALVLLIAWPPAIVAGGWFSTRMRVRFRRAREANSDVTSRIQETVSGIRVIKAYGAEQVEQARFERDSRRAFAEAFRARSLYALFGVLMFWLAGGALLVATAGSAMRTIEDAPLFATRLLASFGFSAWTLGVFNSFKTFGGEGSQGLERIFSLWGKAQDIAIGLDRVFELLDLEPEVEDAPDAIPMPPFETSIEFRGVGFRYQPDRPVLESVDLRSGPGAITAIVGPTGSGKSSLMALLLRLYDPDEGAIEIDGVDLRRFQLASLRDQISIALQENILFGTTIRENIRYARPDASDAQVRDAARVAAAASFIEDLPDGYDTMLGERGTKLSTGQRQRISIARAILKDTSILILDEPTAALDAHTELEVLRNLREWGAGRAIFLITHRLSTVRRADRIVYLEEGRVLESGSHDELVANPAGAYRKLVDLEERGVLAAASS